MRIFFLSRRRLAVLSLMLAAAAVLAAAWVVAGSEAVAVWVQTGAQWDKSVAGRWVQVAYADENDSGVAVGGVTARNALLMDAQTGQVLWQRDGFAEVAPASTTKILTALLALDLAPLEREVEVSAAAAAVGESNVGLLAGERFRLGELLDAALLKSANDACFALAEGVAGSEPMFVRLMNVKAGALGAGGARMFNTNGLPAEGHTMSAYDLALLARVAMQNSEFAGRVGAKTGLMEGGSYNRALKNTNKLLAMNEYVTGVKTGTTNAAGACLVSAMERDGRSVLAVVLHSDDRYGDSLRLLNRGVDGFVNRRLVRCGAALGVVEMASGWFGTEQVVARAAADLWVTLPVGADAGDLRVEYAWREWGKRERPAGDEPLGTLTVWYGDNLLGRVNLVVSESVG